MFNLILLSGLSFLGTYHDLPSCQNAIREIIATKQNPPNQRLAELEESINIAFKNQKSYLCIPVQKVDKK